MNENPEFHTDSIPFLSGFALFMHDFSHDVFAKKKTVNLRGNIKQIGFS